MEINNKVFVVTGGGSGLGAATARMIVAAGVDRILTRGFEMRFGHRCAPPSVGTPLNRGSMQGAIAGRQLSTFCHSRRARERATLDPPGGKRWT